MREVDRTFGVKTVDFHARCMMQGYDRNKRRPSKQLVNRFYARHAWMSVGVFFQRGCSWMHVRIVRRTRWTLDRKTGTRLEPRGEAEWRN